jgi:ABC-type multidrug transport system fused ATPase/permease subunit
VTTTVETESEAPPEAAPPEAPRPQETSLRSVVRTYGETGAWSRGSILLLVCLAANGLLEGLALTALGPALNAGLQSSQAGGPLGSLLSSSDPDTAVIRSVAAFAVLGALSAFATFLVGRLTLHVRYAIEADLRRKMARALLDMPWLPFLEMRLGDIAKTTLLDGAQAAYGVINLLQAIGTAVVAVVFLAIALVLSPVMTVFTLLFGAVAVLAYRRAAVRGGRHTTEVSRSTDELTRETTEVFGGFKYVRASGLTEEAWERMDELVGRVQESTLKSTLPQPTVRLLFEGGGVIFVAGFLAFSLLATSADIGTSLVFLAIFYRLTPRVTVMNDSLYMARVMLPWYASWKAVYQRAIAATEPPSGTLRPERVDELRATGLDFSYPNRANVLSDVSLELRRGTCTAIVGESGSGKTTLMDLLIGLLEPQTGDVTVDGVPLREIDRGWWRRHLGLVMQDSTMFSGTIAENVAIGHAEPDLRRVQECLGMAAAADFVARLPEGLETQIGEGGSKLSGGQRQRLALARALYRDPGLLCLDEATAALDADSERLILDAVAHVKRDRAVLLVSHRVKTLTVADQIVVLADGRIAEVGSWQELTSRPSRFRRLVESQS